MNSSVDEDARSGRRPGAGDTREAILLAARSLFAERGYDGASMRAIGAAAGVDPALIHHYHGTKEALFVAAMRLPINPAEVLPALYDADPATAGERLVRFFLRTWEEEATRSTFLGLLRSASDGGAGQRVLREFMQAALAPLADRLGADGAMRVQLVWSQLFGLALARLLLEVEPLATTSHDELVAAVAPTVQRYLQGAIR
jgi:AcrR family transcriptional regulator